MVQDGVRECWVYVCGCAGWDAGGEMQGGKELQGGAVGKLE